MVVFKWISSYKKIYSDSSLSTKKNHNFLKCKFSLILLYDRNGPRYWENMKLNKNMKNCLRKTFFFKIENKRSRSTSTLLLLYPFYKHSTDLSLYSVSKNFLIVLQVINRCSMQNVYWALQKSCAGLYVFKNS